MSENSKLSQATLSSLDEELFDYNSIAKKIAKRKLELDTQQEYDSNIGGGRANRISDVVSGTVIRYDKDKRIKRLEQLRSDIEECYRQLGEEEKFIFEKRWLLDEVNEWPYIAELTHCSNKTIYRKREAILIKYARAKGKI